MPRYRLHHAYGLTGLSGDDVLARGIHVGLAGERLLPLGKQTYVILGLGMQYGNFERGDELVPCDFPLGDKVIVFSFSETYAFSSLDAVARVGVERRFGRLTFGTSLLPTLRLHDRILATSAIDYNDLGRPNQFVATRVRPGERFTWTDGNQRELRYNTPVRLQGALEVGYALSKRLTLGFGYQTDLTVYEIDNVFPEQLRVDVPCGFVSCEPTPEYTVSTTSVRTGRGYLALHLQL